MNDATWKNLGTKIYKKGKEKILKKNRRADDFALSFKSEGRDERYAKS